MAKKFLKVSFIDTSFLQKNTFAENTFSKNTVAVATTCNKAMTLGLDCLFMQKLFSSVSLGICLPSVKYACLRVVGTVLIDT